MSFFWYGSCSILPCSLKISHSLTDVKTESRTKNAHLMFLWNKIVPKVNFETPKERLCCFYYVQIYETRMFYKPGPNCLRIKSRMVDHPLFGHKYLQWWRDGQLPKSNTILICFAKSWESEEKVGFSISKVLETLTWKSFLNYCPNHIFQSQLRSNEPIMELINSGTFQPSDS